MERLHSVLRPFLLRRLKCDVEKQLPQKKEHVIRYVPHMLHMALVLNTLQSGMLHVITEDPTCGTSSAPRLVVQDLRPKAFIDIKRQALFSARTVLFKHVTIMPDSLLICSSCWSGYKCSA